MTTWSFSARIQYFVRKINWRLWSQTALSSLIVGKLVVRQKKGAKKLSMLWPFSSVRSFFSESKTRNSLKEFSEKELDPSLVCLKRYTPPTSKKEIRNMILSGQYVGKSSRLSQDIRHIQKLNSGQKEISKLSLLKKRNISNLKH